MKQVYAVLYVSFSPSALVFDSFICTVTLNKDITNYNDFSAPAQAGGSSGNKMNISTEKHVQ